MHQHSLRSKLLSPIGVSCNAAATMSKLRYSAGRTGLTPYDRTAVTYARLIDAEADNADWREVARIVLQIDP